MIELQAVYGGPAVHKTEKFNPTEVLIRLIDENPGAPRDTVEKLFIAEIEDDKDYRTPALKYFFWNAWAGLHPQRRKGGKSSKPRVHADRAIADTVQKIKTAVIGEIIMQNGKKLADCTGTEMIRFGGFYAKIGKIAKGRKVGAALSEEQLRKIWKGR